MSKAAEANVKLMKQLAPRIESTPATLAHQTGLSASFCFVVKSFPAIPDAQLKKR